MGLRELAEECGITTEHVDGLGRHVQGSETSILALLRALGVDIHDAGQADAIREERAKIQAPLVAPCLARAANEPCEITLCGAQAQTFELTLTMESGETRTSKGRFDEGPAGQSTSALMSLGSLPVGYHDLLVRSGQREARCRLLAFPAQAYGAPQGSSATKKSWGLFAPLYALRGNVDYGVGDFECLGRLMDWAGSLGASFVGTLPLLAANYLEDFQTSPYSPVSRLFWNELYLDLQSLGALYPSAELTALLADEGTRKAGRSLRELARVDYAECSALRRRLLECIAESAWQSDAEVLEEFARQDPTRHDYACFRAAAEKSGTTWPQWQGPAASGEISACDYEQANYRYHLFAQWAVDQQLAALGAKDCDLYLDLSVGVAGSSFDVWRYQDSFVKGIDVGAPPDGLFEGGQNWALPPLHPQRSQCEGHEYFSRCVRAHMRHAGMLRIDHVMGLHRLYWIPSELSASEGLYVRYPADELYAVLLIESQRSQCILVGEDLGTVPDGVRPAMEQAGMHRLFVGQFATEWREAEQALGLERPPSSAVASLDTHDTATFAGWFATTDLSVDPEDLMKAWTEELASGPAAALVVTLEDLWLEPEPQNRPGTGAEVPNWRHRIVRPLDKIIADPHLAAWLRKVSELRAEAQNR